MLVWLLLALAICLEVLATFLLKLSHGFEKWQWGGLSMLCYAGCFWVLAPVMKVLPLGVVYAIWAGMGILATTLIGFLFFAEHLGVFQLICIALIFAGAIGLRLTTST